MSVEFICDGCGARKPDEDWPNSIGIIKPNHWFAQRDKETGKWLHACSRECIKIAAEKFGTHDLVLPI